MNRSVAGWVRLSVCSIQEGKQSPYTAFTKGEWADTNGPGAAVAAVYPEPDKGKAACWKRQRGDEGAQADSSFKRRKTTQSTVREDCAEFTEGDQLRNVTHA